MARVSKRRPCPVCEKPDWCLVANDGSAAICQRVKSDTPVGTKDAGWLHKLFDDRVEYKPVTRAKAEPERPHRDWPALAERYRKAMTEAGYQHLSDHLGVSIESLRRLHVGWDGFKSVTTWPMRNADSVVVGIRTRDADDKKKSVGGDDGNGLFFDPVSFTQDHLLICEGASDTAALLDCGFESVVGRPACKLGTAYIIAIIKRLKPETVLLIPDNDEAGLAGFGDLAGAIASSGYEVERMDALTPPTGINDIRQWAQKCRDHLAGRIAASLNQIKQRTETSND